MANDKVSANQVSPRLNQVLVSSIAPVSSMSITPGDVPHLYSVKPISSNSLDIGLGTEAEFFDRSGNRIAGKVVLPTDENGAIIVSTLFTPSTKPIVQKVKQGLRVDRKVSARPRRGRQ
jgi:hypothetical protein